MKKYEVGTDAYGECNTVKNQSLRKKKNLINTLKAAGALGLTFGLIALASNSDYKTEQEWNKGIIVQEASMEEKIDNPDSLDKFFEQE